MPESSVEESFERIKALMLQIDEIRKLNKRLALSNVALQEENFYFRTSLPHRLAEGINKTILKYPRFQGVVRFLHYWGKKILFRPTRNQKFSLAELFPSRPSTSAQYL